MRRDGLQYDDIAAQLGYASKAGAWKAVTTALKRREAEAVDELRQLEGMRLDALQAAVWPAAMAGDVQAVRAVVTISERRARLFGLDAPTRNELSGADGGPLTTYVTLEWEGNTYTAPEGTKFYAGVSPDDWDVNGRVNGG